ncbi:hypothetical protein [Mollivirus kamchatka]|nr:hypothetical protein [Mollivirus kamchatka]
MGNAIARTLFGACHSWTKVEDEDVTDAEQGDARERVYPTGSTFDHGDWDSPVMPVMM